ncbi:MAG: bifunctional phosphopantothenoylcysteine decarboxylase/phosphopantothenate--cysteine ligase CoaBC [Actinomycetota bacterium]
MSAHIVIGVAGGIAAYKSVEVVRLLRESGHRVTVAPTRNALNFVGSATFEAISGEPVVTSLWSNAADVSHVHLGQHADLVLVAPATADLLARAAHGIADDVVTNILLTAHGPVVLAPAMHTEMWRHPATQSNVATLRERGMHVLDPAVGRLTGRDSGPGRLPEPTYLADVVADFLDRPIERDMTDLHVVVSLGGTREDWDPVRFLGNRSSGRQGAALARAALLRGARVTAVVGHVECPVPPVHARIDVESAVAMHKAMQEVVFAPEARVDAVVMAAAVADFTPSSTSAGKVKKDGSVPELILSETDDILAGLVAARGQRSSPVLVGFAAETAGDRTSLASLAERKLARKGCDLIIANDVSHGVFGADTNAALIVSEAGVVDEIPTARKGMVAHRVWDQVLRAPGLVVATSD